MKAKITVLGTSCSNPTKERNLSGVCLEFAGKTLLFDCPEGTQRQMMLAGASYMSVDYVFISHFHADHVLGLPGMLATMSMQGRDWPLHVFGPRGIERQMEKVLSLGLLRQGFEIICHEARNGEILAEKDFSIEAVELRHEVQCFGFVFREKNKSGEFQRQWAERLGIPEGPMWSKLQKGESIEANGKTFRPEDVMDYSKGRKGRKISVIMDTLPDEKYFHAIMDSDILIHESSFLQKHAERAKETKHSTAKQAAETAKKTNAKKLLLLHISPRYRGEKEMEEEAKKVFPHAIVAKDLMQMEI